MRARGEEVRIDDTPEVLSKRLASYRSLTEPLIHYYSERRKLLTVDGMMTIEHVTREINRILSAIGAVEPKAAKPAASAKRAKAAPRKASSPAGKKAAQNRQEGRQSCSQGPEGCFQGCQKGQKRLPRKPAKKAAKKVAGERLRKRSRKSELNARDG